MTTITLWYLVTVGGYNSNNIVYSPPMKDLQTCQYLKKTIESLKGFGYIRECIQIPTEVHK